MDSVGGFLCSAQSMLISLPDSSKAARRAQDTFIAPVCNLYLAGSRGTYTMKNSIAPTWQRVLVGILAVLAMASVIAQIVVDPGLNELSTIQWIRLIAAFIGIYLFSHIALKGFLPDFLLKLSKAPNKQID